MAERAARYTAVAIVLHWAIALAIALLIPLGFWMHGQSEDGSSSAELFRAYQLHKSIGLTVLALSVLRLAWRLANPPPSPPAKMSGLERFAAGATHWAFYGLMIGLPMSGWLYVSAGWSIHENEPLPVPTHYFGLFTVPHLFGLQQAGLETRESAAEAAFTAHWVLAYAAIALAVLHVGAALKHHLIDKDAVLAQMVPGLRARGENAPPANAGRLAILGAGLSLTTVAFAAAVFALASPSAPPPQEASTIEIAAPPLTPAEPAPAELAPVANADGAPSWRVNAAASELGFTFALDDGEAASRSEGRFTRWRADIRFDPDQLDQSSVAVSIETASVQTGVAVQEQMLTGAEWFSVAAHPTATFRSSDIRRTNEGYEARGDLTIRGRTHNVTLPFTLAIDGANATMSGTVTIDRRDFGIGQDAEGDDMVGRDVAIRVRVQAARTP